VILFDLSLNISAEWNIEYVGISDEEEAYRDHMYSGCLLIGVTVVIVPAVQGGNYEHLKEDYAVYLDSHYFHGDFGVIDWGRPMVGEFTH